MEIQDPATRQRVRELTEGKGADVVVEAAKAFEAAGAAVSEVKGIVTREMLNGLDHFWRTRLWDDLSKLTPEERKKLIALYGGEYQWPKAQNYLNEVLVKLAKASDTPTRPYRVIILNSSVVNAFARSLSSRCAGENSKSIMRQPPAGRRRGPAARRSPRRGCASPAGVEGCSGRRAVPRASGRSRGRSRC